MSLQVLAQDMASRGRGPDTMLVHMAPKEVAGLQALARAHGGTLTTNPETGLPEAGFLSSILPMVAGLALGPAGFGLTAAQAGLAAGALGTVATGNLRKGLMAGLGAYGGAGLSGALANAGAAQGLMASDAAAQAAMGSGANAKDLLLARGADTAAPGMFGNMAKNMGNLKSGLAGLTEASGRDAFMAQVGGTKGLLRYGAAAALPAVMAPPEKTPMPATDNEQYRYTYDPGRVASSYGPYAGEQTYFRPSFTRMADGGVTEGDNEYKYTYDPVLQRYAPIRTATPMPDDIPHATAGTGPALEGSHSTSPMSQRQSDFFDWMANTEEGRAHRDARGAETGRAISMVMPGGAIVNSLRGVSNALPNFGLIAGIPAAFDDYMAAVAATPAAMQSIQNALIADTIAAQSMGVPGYGYDSAGFGAESGQLGPGATPAEAQAIAEALGASTPDSGPPGADPASDAGRDAGNSGSAPGGGAAAGGLMSLMAQGGISHLGDYSDGGRLLRGPGDGVSDSIPATIADKQPARLADGEFVVPARIVSELGNGSTDAGARKLYAMMDRIQKNRAKSVGKGKVAINSRSEKLLPA